MSELRALRVLVADDEEPVRTLLERSAKRFPDLGNFDVVAVSDGVEALRALQSEDHFDIVISDYTMPQLNGLELFRAAQKLPHRRHTTFVLFSGFVERDVASELISLRAGFIQKPAMAKDVFAQALVHHERAQ